MPADGKSSRFRRPAIRITIATLVMGFERMDHQRHGLTIGIAYEILRWRPQVFPNKRGKKRQGDYMMIGPTNHGILWTVILKRTSERGAYECLTGWPCALSECNLYRRTTAN